MLTHVLWSVDGQHRNLSCMMWKSTYYLSLLWSRFTWLAVYMAALCEWQSLWYILIGMMDFNTDGVYERRWLWHFCRTSSGKLPLWHIYEFSQSNTMIKLHRVHLWLSTGTTLIRRCEHPCQIGGLWHVVETDEIKPRFEILTVVSMKHIIFRDVTLCM